MTLDALAPLLSPAYDLQAADVCSKRVLVRVDFNVPISATGKVLDDSRIAETLPTLRLLLGRGARVILASHLGRPDPETQNHAAMVSEFSLQPVAQRLEQLLGAAFKGRAADCIGPAAEAAVAQLEDGQVRSWAVVRCQLLTEHYDACLPATPPTLTHMGLPPQCEVLARWQQHGPLPALRLLAAVCTGVPAGEPALPCCRGDQRQGLCAAAGSTVRCVCQ